MLKEGTFGASPSLKLTENKAMKRFARGGMAIGK